jgi:hypothetical protein
MARSADARGIERSAGDRDFRRRGVGGNCPGSLFDRDTSRPCGVGDSFQFRGEKTRYVSTYSTL